MANVVEKCDKLEDLNVYRGDIFEFVGPGSYNGTLWIVVGPARSPKSSTPGKYGSISWWRLASLVDGTFWSDSSCFGSYVPHEQFIRVGGATIRTSH